MTPEFAIIGHPNEGKSSILSTLAEDDSVRISARSGETTECRTFPVKVDGQTIISFTDTPGFQNPSKLLSILKKSSGSAESKLSSLAETIKEDESCTHDYELLKPLLRGAGIIYIVDGSRNVRNIDRVEMEILRLTGRPRMAIINCKNKENYLSNWKNEFSQNFNCHRIFNAHKASFTERVNLFKSIASIEQDWQKTLDEATQIIITDWQQRTDASLDIIIKMLSEIMVFETKENQKEPAQRKQQEEKVLRKYTDTINKIEQVAHKQIRKLYKHNVFNYELPPNSLINTDIFSDENWRILGLSQQQIVLASSLSGAAIGAGLDVAAAGLSFGVFTLAGGAVGAVGALLGGKKAVQQSQSLIGLKLAKQEIKVGPSQDIALLIILINRALLFYRHITNWAHGRRDYNQETALISQNTNDNFTKDWQQKELMICKNFIKRLDQSHSKKKTKANSEFSELLRDTIESF